jgi:hypothetical protein
MLSRPQNHAHRARINEMAERGRSDPAAAELGSAARELLASLEELRTSELRVRATVAELVAACQGGVIADRLGDVHPLANGEHLRLAPGRRQHPDIRPAMLLAATAGLSELLGSAVEAEPWTAA